MDRYVVSGPSTLILSLSKDEPSGHALAGPSEVLLKADTTYQ
jgi:hypothetical protein